MYSSNKCNGLLSGGVRELLPSGDARLAPIGNVVWFLFPLIVLCFVECLCFSCCFHKIQYLTFLL